LGLIKEQRENSNYFSWHLNVGFGLEILVAGMSIPKPQVVGHRGSELVKALKVECRRIDWVHQQRTNPSNFYKLEF
jgi:hypothetical protein